MVIPRESEAGPAVMTVTVIQKQHSVKLDIPALKRHAAALAARAQALRPGGPSWREVAIHLLDDRQMRGVNRAVMGHEGATDVITQRYDPIPGEPGGLVGELFVDVEWAVRKAPRRKGWGADREILLYIAHGCDHLTGADDQTPDDRRRMRRRELRWLSALPSPAGLLRPAAEKNRESTGKGQPADSLPQRREGLAGGGRTADPKKKLRTSDVRHKT